MIDPRCYIPTDTPLIDRPRKCVLITQLNRGDYFVYDGKVYQYSGFVIDIGDDVYDSYVPCIDVYAGMYCENVDRVTKFDPYTFVEKVVI